MRPSRLPATNPRMLGRNAGWLRSDKGLGFSARSARARGAGAPLFDHRSEDGLSYRSNEAGRIGPGHGHARGMARPFHLGDSEAPDAGRPPIPAGGEERNDLAPDQTRFRSAGSFLLATPGVRLSPAKARARRFWRFHLREILTFS